jgi:predicted metal-dependent phosphoesterase TrpH
MILKTNLHFHTKEGENVPYDIHQAVDCAREKGFDVLAYTSHKKFLCKEEYVKYAENKGILLIPSIEMEIDKKHIVVLNCDKEIEDVKSFQELADYKNKNPQILILAPHPFVFSLKSLRQRLLENIDLFDAIEMTVFSNKLFNFNKRAGEVTLKYNKPFIATSDTHFLKDFERGYALVNASERTSEAVLSAVKKGNFQNRINPMGPFAMLKWKMKMALRFLI